MVTAALLVSSCTNGSATSPVTSHACQAATQRFTGDRSVCASWLRQVVASLPDASCAASVAWARRGAMLTRAADVSSRWRSPLISQPGKTERHTNKIGPPKVLHMLMNSR